MRALLVVNPSAAGVSERRRELVEKAIAAAHELRVAETTHRGHATELAREAASEGLGAVVVLAGDGTLNEAANGLVGSTTALAALPGGSTNVFARSIGMENDVVEATGQLLAAMAAGARRRVGVGTANGRAFLLHVGMGFDAAVVAQVERRSSLKRLVGQAVFVHAALDTWLRHYDRRRPRLSLTSAELSVADAYFAICQNTRPYTFLGERPLDTAPAASLDGRLSLVVFRALDVATVLRAAAAALGWSGSVPQPGRLVRVDGVGSVAVRGYGPFPYQLDGDYLGEVESLEVRHEPERLELFVPLTAR